MKCPNSNINRPFLQTVLVVVVPYVLSYFLASSPKTARVYAPLGDQCLDTPRKYDLLFVPQRHTRRILIEQGLTRTC